MWHKYRDITFCPYQVALVGKQSAVEQAVGLNIPLNAALQVVGKHAQKAFDRWVSAACC